VTHDGEILQMSLECICECGKDMILHSVFLAVFPDNRSNCGIMDLGNVWEQVVSHLIVECTSEESGQPVSVSIIQSGGNLHLSPVPIDDSSLSIDGWPLSLRDDMVDLEDECEDVRCDEIRYDKEQQ